MLLRIQSPEGTKRIELRSNISTAKLYEKAKDVFELSNFLFSLFKNKGQKDEIVSSKSKKVDGYQLKHGDMLYLVPSASTAVASTSEDMETQSEPDSRTSSSSAVARDSQSKTSPSVFCRSDVEEDLVDRLLWKQDGKIPRQRDEKLCRHGANGRCIHCTPLEPYNESYLKENNIKHMSFHSYMRKLTGGVDRGKFAALEDISCKIKPDCTGHPPWPKGICSKCQPNAVTLNRQTYRHVDNVVFENPALVERFLDFWRRTGSQRLGLLVGRYEVHRDVPLGIKATVCAIYEPPQVCGRDGLQLLEDPQAAAVQQLAGALGLQLLGWMFTDLITEDSSRGTVKHLRGLDTWFLSAQECMMAGHLQSLYKNPCRLSPSGQFGSKFVTVVVSGDSELQVHMEGYQLSNQGMALVRDGCCVPTLDAPELAWIRESSNQQYVPDVFYKENDEYGNEVTKLARPLPIAYLLVDVPVSTPRDPLYTFHVPAAGITPFPVENRMMEGHTQDFSALTRYIQQFDTDRFISAVSDFHLLLYLSTMDTVNLKECMSTLLSAVLQQDPALAMEFQTSDQWQTVVQLMEASSGPSAADGPAQMSAASNVVGGWSCQHCTYLNPSSKNTCEICQLPKV